MTKEVKKQDEPKNAVLAAMGKAQKPGTMAGLKHTDVSTVLASMSAQVAQALPKHLTPERVIQMASGLIAKNPAIAECTAPSLMGAVMQASVLGFPPVDSLGYCYFVPYNRNIAPRGTPAKWVKEVQFQIGYKGFIELARRSGKIKMVYAEVVREGDEFEHSLGLNPVLEHKPSGQTSGTITHAYGVAHYVDGGYNFIVLSRAEIEGLRQRSPMQKATPSGPWATDYAAMAKSKAIKQLSKYMPLTLDYYDQQQTDGATMKPENFANNQTGTLQVETLDYANPEDVSETLYIDEKTGEILTPVNE